MKIAIPASVINFFKFKRKKPSNRRVFRVFKRLDNGSFLIAGFVDRYETYNGKAV